MPIENSEIVNKFKEEGINEGLSNGLNFETEDELSSWVETYKSGLPEQKKGIEDYTKEELLEFSKDPQFKGLKGLQGFADSLRSNKKAATTTPETSADNNSELLQEFKKISSKFEELENKQKKKEERENFNNNLNSVAKELNLDSDFVDQFVKPRLPLDADIAKIRAEMNSVRDYFKRKNIANLGTPGGGGGVGTYSKNALSKKYAEREKAKKTRK